MAVPVSVSKGFRAHFSIFSCACQCFEGIGILKVEFVFLLGLPMMGLLFLFLPDCVSGRSSFENKDDFESKVSKLQNLGFTIPEDIPGCVCSGMQNLGFTIFIRPRR